MSDGLDQNMTGFHIMVPVDPDFLDKAMEEEAANGPPKTVFSEISSYAQQLEALDVAIEEKEKELSELKEKKTQLETVTIPTIMMRERIENIGLDNGRQMTMKPVVSVRVPKNEEGRKKVLQFLYDHGAGHLIKDSLTVEDAPESLRQKLVEEGIAFDTDISVNTNSLVAWAKGVLGMTKGSVQTIAKDDFPKEADLFIANVASISKPKR